MENIWIILIHLQAPYSLIPDSGKEDIDIAVEAVKTWANSKTKGSDILMK